MFVYTVSQKKCTNFETVQLKIIRTDFDDIWQKYSKCSRIEFACFRFPVGLLFFINFSSFKPDTKNNANFDAVSSKFANFDEVHFLYNIYLSSQYLAHIICTHLNIIHSSNELLLMQFYLFNIRPKLHHQKWRKSRVTLFRTFSISPAACWCCSLSNLYPETVINCQAL